MKRSIEIERVWMEMLEGRVMLYGSQVPPWSNGVDPATLPLISEQQPGTGLTGGDNAWFAFNGEARQRYAFDTGKYQARITVWDQHGHRAILCGDCGEPMPYSGTYYIQAAWDSGEVFPYTFAVKKIVDDQEGGQVAARAFDVGTPVSGSIDYFEDEDWFKFAAAAGASYAFEAMRADEPLSLEIYSVGGTQLEADFKNDPCCASGLEWVAPAQGTYYLRVSNDQTSDYTLYSVQQKTADPRGPGVAPLLSMSSRAAGSLARPGDVQYFSFAAVTNATYRIQLHDGTLAGQILVGLMDSDGTFINSGQATYQRSGSDDYTSSNTWTAPADGIYYLMVRSLTPGDAGNYTIEINEERDDYSNSAAEPALIGLDEDVNGSIQYERDEDWFAVDATAGQTYWLGLMRLNPQWGDGKWRRRFTCSWDLLLTIFDQKYQELASAQSQPLGGVDGLWTAPSSGRFLIQVRTLGVSVPYSLRVEMTPPDENPPAQMHAGDSVGIQLGAAGDWVTLRLIGEAGKKYWLKFPAGKVSVSAYQPYLVDFNSDSWWSNDDDGVFIFEPDRDSSIDVEFSANGPVSWWAYMEDHSGRAHPAPALAPAEEEETPARASGEKELADEQDVRAFLFTAVAGNQYIFQTVLGTLEDSTLTVYDSEGNVVDENDDVSDDDLSSLIEWTAEKSGVYYIVVGGFGGGSFELSAHEGEGEQRKDLKLEALAVEDARMQFGGDSSDDAEESDDSEDGWLSEDDDAMDFSDEWDWGA